MNKIVLELFCNQKTFIFLMLIKKKCSFFQYRKFVMPLQPFKQLVSRFSHGRQNPVKPVNLKICEVRNVLFERLLLFLNMKILSN